MKKTISVLLSLILLFCCIPPVLAEDARLTFREDGTFRILHLTDTQDDAYPAWDMLNLLREAVTFSQPDLIVLTGDLVEDSRIGDVGVDAQPGREGVNVRDLKGNLDAEKTRRNVEAAVDAVFGVLEEYEIPYVIALGNNDRKVGLTGADWIEILTRYPHCILFDESPDAADGVDYHVTVKGRDGTDKFAVWLMDTCAHGISDEQVDWYKAASAALTEANGGKAVPAFAFQHIQASDVGNLFVPCAAADPGARKAKNGWLRLDAEIAGGYNFRSFEPGEPSYEFRAWKDCGDVIGAFFGHQHVEGFTGVYDGIELGLTYGCEFAKTGPYGFRVLTLHEDDVLQYDNVLYRYTGKVKLGNVKLVAEDEITGKKPSNAYETMLLRLRELLMTFVSLVAFPFV